MQKMKLRQLTVKGFKSIQTMAQPICFGEITVMLGANGSGKSNLVDLFKMLGSITGGELQIFIARQGGAEALLHYGAKRTSAIEFSLSFEQGRGKRQKRWQYAVMLRHGMPDRLFWAVEQIECLNASQTTSEAYSLNEGDPESGLPYDLRPSSKALLAALREIRVYQFHDTSSTARVKSNAYIDDVRYLQSDAGNLAAFLRGLLVDDAKRRYYERIKRHIARIMPQFADFELTPLTINQNNVRLNWRERGVDYLFGPHQISDGSLRFMALTALLLQPPEMLPEVIVLDEPELGLHPAAIAELAGMIRVAAQHAQVIIATQSTRLVDEFEAQDLIIVERNPANHATEFKRLDQASLQDWLTRYSLSELWEKNVLGGQP